MAKDFETWRRIITGNYAPGPFRNSVLAVAQQLSESDLPIVFTISQIAEATQIDPLAVRQMLNATGKFYREFQIPKRRGGFRAIDVPYPSLMTIQRWIHRDILSKREIHPAVHGFVQHRSIVTNATQHVGKNAFLRMDIKDFFPTINLARVISVFQYMGYLPRTSYFLASLCTKNGTLPQGAPTSPLISNIVCGMLDRRLVGLAQSFSLTYTRYADDLVFSGDSIAPSFAGLVSAILTDEGFAENKEKTFLAVGNNKKIVTGLSVSGDVLKVIKKSRRQWRQEFHYVRKFGFIEHSFRIKNPDPLYLESLVGKFCFWHFVEPENKFVSDALAQLRTMQDHFDGMDLPPI